MPEFVAVEYHQHARCDRHRTRHRCAFGVPAEQFIFEPAARSIDQAQQNRIARALVVRSVVVKADVIAGLGVVIERVGMRIVGRAMHQRATAQTLQKRTQRDAAIEGRKTRRVGVEFVTRNAAAFLVTGNEVAVYARFELRQVCQQRRERALGQRIRNSDELIIGGEFSAERRHIERRQLLGQQVKGRGLGRCGAGHEVGNGGGNARQAYLANTRPATGRGWPRARGLARAAVR